MPDVPGPSTEPAVFLSDDVTYPVRTLRLVVPARLGEAAVLRAQAAAITEIGQSLSHRLAEAPRRRQEAATQGTPLAQACFNGEARAYRTVLEELNDELIGRLRVYDQQEAADGITGASEDARLGTDTTARPAFPLPTDGPAGAAIAPMLAVRDGYLGMALRSAAGAHLDNGDPTDPGYRELLGQVRSWAIAADQLEAALASFTGVPAEFEAFIEAHGTWLERVI